VSQESKERAAAHKRPAFAENQRSERQPLFNQAAPTSAPDQFCYFPPKESSQGETNAALATRIIPTDLPRPLAIRIGKLQTELANCGSGGQ
jgi:hypothetical protein